MTTIDRVEEMLANVFDPTAGVVGAVDRLLEHAARRRIELHWSANCVVARIDDGETERHTMPKSAFRAMLARVSALCEPMPGFDEGTVSPYVGSGVVVSARVAVLFTNTPSEQRLTLRPI